MESLTIEVLANIFGYLPAKDVEIKKLVNTQFYEAASRALSFKRPLEINIPKLIEESIYQSMMLTSRRFKVLVLDIAGINDWTADRLLELQKKTGSSISALEIRHQRDPTPLKLANLVKMFGAMDLKRIVIEDKYNLDIDTMPVLQLSHAATGVIDIARQLSYLPKLELTSDGDGSGWTLQYIEFHAILGVDASIFHNMRIQKLSVKSPPYDYRSIDAIDATRMLSNNFTSEILTSQNSIEELDLDFFCSSNLLRNMTTLKKLDLALYSDAPIEICALGNLINLEDLKFRTDSDSTDMIETFLGIAFPNLKCLDIEGTWPEYEDGMLREMMSANWPKLQELKAADFGFAKINLKDFLDSLPGLTSLYAICFPVRDFQFQHSYPALRVLSIDFLDEDMWIISPEFITAFPNLDKLIISSLILKEEFIVRRETMQAILDSQIQTLALKIRVQQNDRNEIERLIERMRANMKSVEIEIL